MNSMNEQPTERVANGVGSGSASAQSSMRSADVKATGSNGKDGDSFFESVSDGDDAVTFVLTDGTEIVIPKTSVSSFGFVKPDDGRSYFIFDFGKKKTLMLNTTDVETADFMNVPEGWKATLNLAKNSVTVQAPAAGCSLLRRHHHADRDR